MLCLFGCGSDEQPGEAWDVDSPHAVIDGCARWTVNLNETVPRQTSDVEWEVALENSCSEAAVLNVLVVGYADPDRDAPDAYETLHFTWPGAPLGRGCDMWLGGLADESAWDAGSKPLPVTLAPGEVLQWHGQGLREESTEIVLPRLGETPTTHFVLCEYGLYLGDPNVGDPFAPATRGLDGLLLVRIHEDGTLSRGDIHAKVEERLQEEFP